VSSPCDPEHASTGDVSAALMVIDSRLKGIFGRTSQADAEQQALTDQFFASLDAGGAGDLVDGVCTLIYMFMQWLRMAYEDHSRNVIEYVVPNLVTTMRRMSTSIRPEVIPTMAGLLVAAAIGLHPGLWRKQYGPWTTDEMNALEATAFLLAEHINRLTDDRDFATRLITEALSSADEG
jgi:hypothetical protein